VRRIFCFSSVEIGLFACGKKMIELYVFMFTFNIKTTESTITCLVSLRLQRDLT